MPVIIKTISFSTEKETDMVNITDMVEKIIRGSPLTSGICNIFIPGATGAVICVEYEPGLKKDIPRMLETKIAPKNEYYAHHETWHDDNGHSHVRAALLGPDLTVPFQNKRLIHGSWQQLAFIELDTRPRNRTLYVTLIGE